MSDNAQQIQDAVFTALAASRGRAEAVIEAEMAQWRGPARLLAAMRYAVTSGGKRIRPTLALEIAGFAGGEDAMARAQSAACALEWIHTYSLIHDDLPALDDDDERRGRPTVHRQFNEAMAILAGDALQAEAFGLAARPDQSGRSDAMRAAQTASLARWSGVRGMCGGQAIDMDGIAKTADQMRAMHTGKTGGLFVAACEIAAIAAGCDAEAIAAWGGYGVRFGLAFQLSDDVLDLDEAEDSEHEADVNLAVLMGSDAALERIQTDCAEGHILLHRLDVPAEHALHRLLDWNLARARGALE